MIPNRHYCDSGVSAANQQVEKKEQEKPVVLHAQTVVHPGAVVVHHEDASVADAAVVSPRRLDFVTGLAEPVPGMAQTFDGLCSVLQHLFKFAREPIVAITVFI